MRLTGRLAPFRYQTLAVGREPSGDDHRIFSQPLSENASNYLPICTHSQLARLGFLQKTDPHEFEL